VRDPEVMAREILELWGRPIQIEPFGKSSAGLSILEAYEIAGHIRRIRIERGDRAVGRKIGFTNRSIWEGFGISAPIWATVYESTVNRLEDNDSFAISHLPEPRIEPELVLHLARKPQSGMPVEELSACVDWVALGFEIVHSIFPHWSFQAADAVAAFGVHSALFIGPELELRGALPQFNVVMGENQGIVRSGRSTDVLGGPFEALHHLHQELAMSANPLPLQAGEIITTGTLTEAMAASAGQDWTLSVTGLSYPTIRLKLI
jgi:2-keto-4-pentenoate hydratase